MSRNQISRLRSLVSGYESLHARRLLAADVCVASEVDEVFIALESLSQTGAGQDGAGLPPAAVDEVIQEFSADSNGPDSDIETIASAKGALDRFPAVADALEEMLFDNVDDAENPDDLELPSVLYTLMSLLNDAANADGFEDRAYAAGFLQLLKDYSGQDSFSSLPEGTDTLTDYLRNLSKAEREALTEHLENGMRRMRDMGGEMLPGY